MPLYISILIHPAPPRSTLFPYTTLFRSRGELVAHEIHLGPDKKHDGLGIDEDAHAAVFDHLVERARAFRIIHGVARSEEHTSELQSQSNLVCRLLLEKKKKTRYKR